MEFLFVQRYCECCADTINIGVFSDQDHAKKAIRFVAGQEEDELEDFDENTGVWQTSQEFVYYLIEKIAIDQIMYEPVVFIPEDEEDEDDEH